MVEGTYRVGPQEHLYIEPQAMIATTGEAIAQAFDELRNLDPDAVRKLRRQKFLDIGRKLG